ncbi:MAG TPA: serine hydrolase, partial [Gemmatimonadales bacterium]|nr:serine hydrolase [Gemmatimonadales bacterium]
MNVRTLIIAGWCVAALGAPLAAQAPRPVHDLVLQRELERAVAGADGTVGVYVRNLRTGRWAGIRQDSLFPTASMIKVPILIATWDAIARGALRYDTVLTFADSLRYDPDEDLFAKLRDSAKVPLDQAILMMITTSDNTAALWLQSLCGGGTVINQWLAGHGFEHTRVNSRTEGRHDDWVAYGWGQTTPREMTELFTLVRQGKAVSPAASEAMYRALTRIYWNGEALSQLPPWVQAASKQGAVNQSRSETVLVNAPSGDYVFSVITKGQSDSSWVASNAGYVLIRRISALLWRHFEPRHPYTPPKGSEAYHPA